MSTSTPASTFVSMSGVVQQFPDKPVVTERETSAGVIREFAMRTNNQTVVRVSVFPEYAQALDGLSGGDGVFADGAYSERPSNDPNRPYCNLTAKSLAFVPVAPREASSSRPSRAAKASF